MEQLKSITNLLRDKGLRVTQARIAVAEVLVREPEHFFTSEEIYSRIKKSKKHDCDQASVYRCLSAFEELGIVAKSSFHGEAARFQILPTEKDKHHHEHYFKCQGCDEIEPLEDCLVAKKERELEARGYANLKHHLEIIGLCPRCAH